MIESFDASSCRKTLAEFVQAGVCDRRVIELLKQGDYFLPVECELIDYKSILPNDTVSLAKTYRHIMAFHNTFGGYLIFGVSEKVKDTHFETFGCGRLVDLNIKQIKDKLYAYSGVDIALSGFEQTVDGDKNIVVLYIPKRAVGITPKFFGKDGAQDDDKKPVFKKQELYWRRGDNSEPALGEPIAFLFTDRDCPYLNGISESKKSKTLYFEHNLPDRTFICPRFIGRTYIIEKLWMWFADAFSYVRVLAGEGGLGKTSIAYEFAMQVCANSPIELERVLWVTAKTRQFLGDRNEYVEVPETHFNSYTSLLKSLCSESAIPDSQIEGADDNLLKHFLKDALQILPTLVIVDDVDTLSSEDQKRVLELAMQLANTKSRFLLTTRKNVSYSPDIAIEIKGLQDVEYPDYISLIQDRFDGPALTGKEISSLYVTTHGSPLFTDSLYRMIRRGDSAKKASDEWRGKEGIAARAAALLIEVESLSDESKRVLLAVSILQSCSLTELSQACQYFDDKLNDCIDELAAYYLISGPRIGGEPRFEVLDTMRTFVIQIKDKLVAGSAKFEQEVLALRKIGIAGKNINKNPLVGNAISEASAFLRNGQIDEALNTVSVAQRRSGNHPDLYLMQGKCCMSGPTKRPDEGRRAFGKAYEGGVRKSLLFELWYQAEMDLGHSVGAEHVAQLALGEKFSTTGRWEVKKAEAQVRLAIDHEKAGYFEKAIKVLTSAAQLTFENVDKLPPQNQFPVKESLATINNEIMRISRRLDRTFVNYLDMVERIIQMTERKDFRRITLSNLVYFLQMAFPSELKQNSRYQTESIRFKPETKLKVLEVLKKALEIRVGDSEFVDELANEVKAL